MRPQGKSSSRSRRDKSKEEEKPDRKKLYLAGAGAGAVAVVILVVAGVLALLGPKEKVDTRSDSERNSAERQVIENEMQKDIERATAAGRSREEIEKIRKGYTDSLKQIGK